MSKKKQTKIKVSKKLAGSKATKKPKFKLVSYTLKAVIPTGQYANIQPEVTVEAETMEEAERAVMPYIETLFARYRDGGVKPIEPVRPVVVQKPVVTAPKPPVTPVQSPVVNSGPKGVVIPAGTDKSPVTPPAPVSTPMASLTPTPAPMAASVAAPAPIVMSVPFTRAKGALDSCTSLAAHKLVSNQIANSTKLIDSEKVELRKLANAKFEQLNGGTKTV